MKCPHAENLCCSCDCWCSSSSLFSLAFCPNGLVTATRVWNQLNPDWFAFVCGWEDKTSSALELKK